MHIELVSSNIIHVQQVEFKLQGEEYPNVIHITPLHVIWSHYGYLINKCSEFTGMFLISAKLQIIISSLS